MLEVLVGAFGLFLLGGVYLALAPADRGPGDCASCSLKEDPTLCGGCGLPETPPPDAGPFAGPERTRGFETDPWTPPTDPGRPAGPPPAPGAGNGPREEAP